MDGSAYSRMFDGVVTLVCVLGFLSLFGVWKLIEIVVWVVRHLSVTIQ